MTALFVDIQFGTCKSFYALFTQLQITNSEWQTPRQYENQSFFLHFISFTSIDQIRINRPFNQSRPMGLQLSVKSWKLYFSVCESKCKYPRMLFSKFKLSLCGNKKESIAHISVLSNDLFTIDWKHLEFVYPKQIKFIIKLRDVTGQGS